MEKRNSEQKRNNPLLDLLNTSQGSEGRSTWVDQILQSVRPSAALANSQASAAGNPRVSTDKADYAPGETVVISASGFRPGETITFAIADDPLDPGDDGDADIYTPFSITDGGEGDLDGQRNGHVETSWQVPGDDDGSGSGTPDALNATLKLMATGTNGQVASYTFTDSAPSVVTDKADYAPGETVTITASGFTAGSTIEFGIDIVSAPGSDGVFGTADDVVDAVATAWLAETPWQVRDGSEADLDPIAGSIGTSWIVDPDALNATLRLTTKDSGADGILGTEDDRIARTAFTDGPKDISPINAISGQKKLNDPSRTLDGYTNGNITLYSEGDYINFVADYSSNDNGKDIGVGLYRFSRESSSVDFFDPYFELGTWDYGTGYPGSQNREPLEWLSGAATWIVGKAGDPFQSAEVDPKYWQQAVYMSKSVIKLLADGIDVNYDGIINELDDGYLLAAITGVSGNLTGVDASASNTKSWFIDDGLIKPLSTDSLASGKLWYSTDSDLAYESSVNIVGGKIQAPNGEFITGGGYSGNDSNALNVNFNLRIAEDVSGATGSSQQVQLENIYWKNNAGKPVGAPDLAANYFSSNDVVITGNKTLPMPAKDIIRLPDLMICKEISRTTDPLDFVPAEPGEYQFYLYLDNPTSGTLGALDAADVQYTNSPYVVGPDGCITITNLDATFNNANDANYDYLIDQIATWFITEEQLTGETPYTYFGSAIELFNGAQTGPSSPPEYLSVRLAGQSGTDAQSAVVTWQNIPELLALTLNGRKLEDFNANGVEDPGDTGLDGWIIRLTSDSTGLEVATATTQDGGVWTMPLELMLGYYTISEVLQGPYYQSGPDPDAPPNGVDGEYKLWVQGVTEYTVFTDKNGNDLLDPGETFYAIPPGPAQSIDFFNYQLASKSGYKLEDVDGDGDGDSAVSGWLITLYDADGNEVATDTTDGSGFYEFTDLRPGDYSVVEEMQPGWSSDYSDTIEFTLTSGENETDNNFINWQYATKSGYKLEDVDQSGTLTEGDIGIEGWNITLYNANGDLVATDTTDADGKYEFLSLRPGEYTVTEETRAGYLNSSPTSIDFVLTSGENEAGNNFFNFRVGECGWTPGKWAGGSLNARSKSKWVSVWDGIAFNDAKQQVQLSQQAQAAGDVLLTDPTRARQMVQKISSGTEAQQGYQGNITNSSMPDLAIGIKGDLTDWNGDGSYDQLWYSGEDARTIINKGGVSGDKYGDMSRKTVAYLLNVLGQPDYVEAPQMQTAIYNWLFYYGYNANDNFNVAGRKPNETSMTDGQGILSYLGNPDGDVDTDFVVNYKTKQGSINNLGIGADGGFGWDGTFSISSNSSAWKGFATSDTNGDTVVDYRDYAEVGTGIGQATATKIYSGQWIFEVLSAQFDDSCNLALTLDGTAAYATNGTMGAAYEKTSLDNLMNWDPSSQLYS
jgi:hypothetical protein